ncbi:MAG: transglycosylase SLT domain-containing protein [Chitinivibrionia bacterium]|nr:transglycosylase SLT domain-containing protein [Chitinivibrionia bacterium]
MKIKFLATAIFLLLQSAIFGREITVGMLDSLIENYSVGEILKGNYEKAEKQIRSIEYNDSGLFYLALGEIELRKGNREMARMNFIIASEISEKVAPFSYRKMGDMELDGGNLAYAVSAFRIAAQRTDFETYRSYLLSRVDSLKNAFPDSLGSVAWGVLFWDEERDGDFEISPIRILQKRIKEEKLTPDLYNELHEIAKERNIEKNFFAYITDTTRIDASFDTKTAFSVASEMFKNGQDTGASNWLHFAMNKSDFNKAISRRRYLELRIDLNFSLKNYGNVVKFGEEYLKEYGESLDLLYKLGRAHRRNGNPAKAHSYYDRCIKNYPNSKIAHDILWYMAWSKEESRNFDAAKELFSQIANQKPRGKHAEEAALRTGLLDFRQKKYDAALQEFAEFRKKIPSSIHSPASYYWSARAYLAKNDASSARKMIDTLNTRFPLTYYDFRSRELSGKPITTVLKVSDSVWYSRLDSVTSSEAKSKKEKAALKELESDELDNLLLGIFLGTMGLTEEAQLLFEPIENQNQRNFPMVLTLAKFYDEIGAHFRSYRLARRIYWALPSNRRGEFSPEYLRLLYPNAYSKEIDTSSQKYDVDPHLVRSVMRQESMFSPTVLSPVGAMGLMQIMPATGKGIADELKLSFDKSKLLSPSLNVDFGAYYLNKRLKQFNGNVVYALGSYNGGSHNVEKWIAENKDIVDDEPYFVECIGFAETRTYVKRVLENYWIYKLMQF